MIKAALQKDNLKTNTFEHAGPVKAAHFGKHGDCLPVTGEPQPIFLRGEPVFLLVGCAASCFIKQGRAIQIPIA